MKLLIRIWYEKSLLIPRIRSHYSATCTRKVLITPLYFSSGEKIQLRNVAFFRLILFFLGYILGDHLQQHLRRCTDGYYYNVCKTPRSQTPYR